MSVTQCRNMNLYLNDPTRQQQVNIEFHKIHHLGNDYIYIDLVDLSNREAFTRFLGLDEKSLQDTTRFSDSEWQAEANRRLEMFVQDMSIQHFGIGSDGVIIVTKEEDERRLYPELFLIPDETSAAAALQQQQQQPKRLVVRMRMYNADGSESFMCGDGLLSVMALMDWNDHLNQFCLDKRHRMEGGGNGGPKRTLSDFKQQCRPDRESSHRIHPVDLLLTVVTGSGSYDLWFDIEAPCSQCKSGVRCTRGCNAIALDVGEPKFAWSQIPLVRGPWTCVASPQKYAFGGAWDVVREDFFSTDYAISFVKFDLPVQHVAAMPFALLDGSTPIKEEQMEDDATDLAQQQKDLSSTVPALRAVVGRKRFRSPSSRIKLEQLTLVDSAAAAATSPATTTSNSSTTVGLSALSVGNPHAVLVFWLKGAGWTYLAARKHVADVMPLEALAKTVSDSGAFPRGVNVSIAAVYNIRFERIPVRRRRQEDNDGGEANNADDEEYSLFTCNYGMTLRTFERGSGETTACGSAACAAAVTASHFFASNPGRFDDQMVNPHASIVTDTVATVSLPGGDCSVSCNIDRDFAKDSTGVAASRSGPPVVETSRGPLKNTCSVKYTGQPKLVFTGKLTEKVGYVAAQNLARIW